MKIYRLKSITVCLILMSPIIIKAQQSAASCFPSVTSAKLTSESSKINYEVNGNEFRVKMTIDGKNAVKGVLFFQKEGACDFPENVVLLKVVNLNKYAVKIKWQQGFEMPKAIIILASSESDGKCDDNDLTSSESKLKYSKRERDKDGNIKHIIFSTLDITEVNN